MKDKGKRKMNDCELAKALKICARYIKSCRHDAKAKCKYCVLNGQEMCSAALVAKAGDRIIRQRKEIENLTAQQKKYPYKVVTGFNSEIHSKSEKDYLDLMKDIGDEACKELKCKIIEQKHALLKQQSYTAELQDKIAELKSHNAVLEWNADTAFQDGLNERRELFEPEIKAEAYKEFAEKLENEINCRTTLSQQQDKNVIHIMHNLLKEMVKSDE